VTKERSCLEEEAIKGRNSQEEEVAEKQTVIREDWLEIKGRIMRTRIEGRTAPKKNYGEV
jgi:hypothetical protein